MNKDNNLPPIRVSSYMPFYDVQITTDLGETVVLQIAASSPEEAELAAIHMVEMGQADVEGTCVVEGFARHA